MPSLGVHTATASGLKAGGVSLPGPGAEELVSALGYLKPQDVELIEAAYEVARAAHAGQFRKSGEPYITHPLAVAKILAEWHLDPQALMAAILHDVVEDTPTTKSEIAKKFGKPVAELVDGVSKIDRIEFATLQHAQAENFRKMLLAMARDVRVILIKLADRLHNMRTLDAVHAEKQERVAKETLEIYAPIANRLGLNALYYELEDLGFRFMHPTRFKVLDKALKKARGNRRDAVGKITEQIQARLKEFKLEAQVTGREKHISSIYKKMQEKNISFSEVFDLYGFRILVPDVASAYLAMGALHTMYKPIPGKFKDYIAIPKANGYQSLHTTLFGPFGMPLELQIRTADMHKVAEAGVASHWLYKSSEMDAKGVQLKSHQWLQSLLEIQSESGDALEFLEHIKVDLFPDEVYVFSPKGTIFSLPKGATAIDFAYAVHTDVGNHCVSARVNGEPVPLGHVLRNGDRIEIVTDPSARPNPVWLSYVGTGKARSHIRHYLKTMQSQESAEVGELLLVQALRSLKANPDEIHDSHWERFFKGDSAKTREEVLADVGLGKRLAVVVAKKLLSTPDAHADPSQPPRLDSITIRGTEGMAVQFSPCCRPIPGDPIIAQIRKGQGLAVHTHDCPAIHPFHFDPEKWVDVQWDPAPDQLFDVNVRLTAANQRGVLARLAAEISEADSDIDHIETEQKSSQAYTTLVFTVQVKNRMHLAHVFRRLRRIPEVVRISRFKKKT
ncbi:RelA/SpoT family protein [Usitatibacter palustris]|uniref:Bifunctional (P)ppGpp synthase/hydrolase SpoT n=1 Tax=Usitatibacter palustris TaxID=2732487 RepID=A0A6M4H1E0_9PROT|nr:bifunctional (p)ppGpp synthetase/guanosine-3',5'-bis(diphosphate) 3'-pyrophosphohydrolase [Usitatibacter palustris]QJR13311.1 Bifunctional (p)ppGpp synthase/hydrolase SpoT [Usitatibacter palustris]